MTKKKAEREYRFEYCGTESLRVLNRPMREYQEQFLEYLLGLGWDDEMSRDASRMCTRGLTGDDNLYVLWIGQYVWDDFIDALGGSGQKSATLLNQVRG